MANVLRYFWPFVLRSEHERIVSELRQAYEQERIRRIMAESRTPIKRVAGQEAGE
jgi:hypothetical protein